MTDRVAELIGIVSANINTDSVVATRAVNKANRELAVEFGRRQGWKLTTADLRCLNCRAARHASSASGAARAYTTATVWTTRSITGTRTARSRSPRISTPGSARKRTSSHSPSGSVARYRWTKTFPLGGTPARRGWWSTEGLRHDRRPQLHPIVGAAGRRVRLGSPHGEAASVLGARDRKSVRQRH